MDIIAAILELTKEGAMKTRILYGATLSFTQLQEYTSFLTEQGLVAWFEEDKVYRITERGMKILEMYKEIDGMIPRENMLTKMTR